MGKEILKVENLTVKFEGFEVLKNLSFKVNKGEILAILGPNGAGKTTLLRALLGLIPYQGKIHWKTKNINYLPPQELFQSRDLPLSVEEFFKLRETSSSRILKILKEVGLNASVLEKRFGALSTGQFQRMLIAWTLINKPEVLLLDEPFYGIDIGGEETIYSLLRKFWKNWNLTILLVTHDLNVIYGYVDNVLCLNKRVLCYGKPKKVLTPEDLQKLYGTRIKFYLHKHD